VPTNSRRAPANRLLASLPRRESQRLAALFEAVELDYGQVLYEPDTPIKDVYFPTSSFISMMIPVDGRTHLEIGLVGNEGMFGAPLVLGVASSPLRALVQGAGTALRMKAATFMHELGRSPTLRQMLLSYMQVLMCQLAQTAACTRFHVVEERLARWLLMSQDRAHLDQFHVTHEFLAYMLGVRRVGVTGAASALQKRNLIRYRRGEVTILHREGMEAASCSCYQADQNTYASLLPAA
jgi:CRP-like cAMP-binding protein